MKFLISYVRPYFGRMAVGISIKFLGTIMDLLLPWILAYIIDSVIPQRQVGRVYLWGGVMVICSVVAILTNIIANRMAARVARDTTQRIRSDLFAKVGSLATAQVEELSVPSLVSRLTTDTYNVHQTVGMVQRLGIRAPILLVGGIFITFTLDAVLTLVLLSLLPITIFVVTKISRKGIPLFSQQQARVDQLVRTVRENISGARVVKALSKADYEKKRFAAVNQALVAAETKANVTMAATPPLMDLFLNLGLTLVVLVSAYRVNASLTQPGVIVAFLTYFTIILNAMLSITRIFTVFSRGIASADRIAAVIHEPRLLQKQEHVTGDSKTYLAFRDVTFHYPTAGKTLQKIAFSLDQGQTLGIIGATGSGKSTIAKLLLRLYDPTDGQILLAGRDLRNYDASKLYPKFGVVLQKDVIFADSLRENIAFGRRFTDDELWEAIRNAQAEEFVSLLPGQLDYHLESKGANLSGGQKQRVLLARAMVGHPELLILDDSASALDYKTDARLRQVLREKFVSSTKIIIAQRISSIQHADKILLLSGGQIIGSGTHEELLAENKVYQEIYQGQTGGEAIVS